MVANITRAFDQNWFIHRRTLTIFSIFLALVCLLHWPYFFMPPVWDTAAGAFAPAIYLFENNGNYQQLIQQAGYIDGGPNVHSFSAITLLTYAAIYITDGNTAVFLPLLHAIHFAFAAIALTATFGLARCLLGTAQAWLLSLCLLMFPVFFVQTGYLYTEILGAALVVLSVKSWSSRRYGRMALFSIMACLVKSFGVVLVTTFIFLLIIDTTLKLSKRIAIATSLLLMMIAIELAKWQSAATSSPGKIIFQNHLDGIISNLSKVPDLRFLVLLSLMFWFAFILHKKLWRPRLLYSHVSALLEDSKKGRAWLAIALIPVAFIGFIVTVPLLTGQKFFPLPRYYVWLLPLMLIIFGSIVTFIGEWMKHNNFIGHSIHQRSFFLVIFATLFVYLTLNRSGVMYPASDRNISAFSISERSMEYLNFFNIQLAGAKSVARYAAGRPVFATRGNYYFLSSPLMGYVDRPIKDLRLILSQPYPSHNLQDFPEEFLLLDSNSNNYHGQDIMFEIIIHARWHTNYHIETLAHHSSGPYKSKLLLISHIANNTQSKVTVPQ